MARSKIATAEAIFWEAIVASAMRARTMPPTLQNTRARRNAALASSSSTGHVVNVRYWGKADIARTAAMSAYDPKRSTNRLRQTKGWAAPVRLSSRKNRSNGGKTVQAQHCSIR